MSSPVSTDEGDPPELVTRNDLFDVLGNERRRYALEAVLDSDGPVEKEAVVERVATREFEKPVEELTRSERKVVNTALNQTHLPKLESEGLITCDDERGVIRPSDRLDEVDVYLEVIEGRRPPFGLVYLTLSVVAGLAIVGAAADLAPVAGVPDVALVSSVVAAFGVLAFVHVQYMRRRKLDTGTVAADLDIDLDLDDGDRPGYGSRPSLSGAAFATAVAAVVAGAGMWVILNDVMYLTPLLVETYGLDGVRWAWVPHAGHSLAFAALFVATLRWTRVGRYARSVGETAALGTAYGVGLWFVGEGIVLPAVVGIQAPTLLTVRGQKLLYLPLDGLAAHVVFGAGLGITFALVARALSSPE
jgi:hypothetical protein